jgi:hypothetical protein
MQEVKLVNEYSLALRAGEHLDFLGISQNKRYVTHRARK